MAAAANNGQQKQQQRLRSASCRLFSREGNCGRGWDGERKAGQQIGAWELEGEGNWGSLKNLCCHNLGLEGRKGQSRTGF